MSSDSNRVRDTLTEVRNPDCHAELFDDGKQMRIPVCMGGTAIVGCNNFENCAQLYNERVDMTHEQHMVDFDDEGRVDYVMTVPRGRLVPRP